MGVKYSNNAETTLSSAINNSTTSISVASSSSFPAITGSDYFYATIDDATNLEIVKVTAVSGTTWTVVRGQDDTTARAFSSGDTVELRINTAMLTDVVNDARTSTFVKQAFTGDGSTTDYTLSQTPGSENDLIVFIEGVFQTQSAYSLSGAVLSFSVAPANTREIVVYHLTDAVSGDSMYHNSYTGNGSTTAYTLSIDPIHENNLIVFLDGVYQNRSTYSVSGTTLTLDAAPANGVAIEVTIHTQTEINVPATNSVGTAQLQDNSVTSAKIAADVIVAEDLAANSITVAELSKTALSGQTGVTAAANDYVLIGDASDSDNLKKALVSSITATTSSVSALTASGVVTANAGVVVDNITIDGTEIDLSSGDLIIDVAGGIVLDADDSGTISFKDGGTRYGLVQKATNDFEIKSMINDGDILFKGLDDSSTITALTLDMSDAGKATFNSGVVTGGPLTLGDYIEKTSGNLTLDVAGDIILDADGGDIEFKDGGSTIGYISNSSNNFQFLSNVSDADIVFKGVDGGSTITALTLDMSDAGAATFNAGISLAGTITTTAATPSVILYESDTTDVNTQLLQASGDFRIRTRSDDGSTNTDRLRIDHAGGSVLIGQDSGDSFNSDSMLRLQRTGDRVFMQFKTDADQNSGILFGDVDDDVECAIEYEPANKALTFSTGNNAEALRIDTNQNIGIGTTAPFTPFHVSTEGAPDTSGNVTSGLVVSHGVGGNAIKIGVHDSGALNYIQSGYVNNIQVARNFAIFSGASEALRIDTNGKVGIGTSSPSEDLHVKGGSGSAFIRIDNSADGHDTGFEIYQNGSRKWEIHSDDSNTDALELRPDGVSGKFLFTQDGKFAVGATSASHLIEAHSGAIASKYDGSHHVAIRGLNGGQYIQYSSANPLEFVSIDTYPNSGATSRARLTTNGHWLVGTTSSTINSSNFGAVIFADGRPKFSKNVSGSSHVMNVYGNAGEMRVFGDGDVINTNNSYGQISDVSLKENIVDASSKLADINKVKVRNFNFKGNDLKQIGVVAQELETVFPALVTTDEEEDIKTVKYSVFVPILIKALQEADDKIDALEARIATLESS